jgi:hypothetical protein
VEIGQLNDKYKHEPAHNHAQSEENGPVKVKLGDREAWRCSKTKLAGSS